MPIITQAPFTILVDTSEQLPYTFASIRADAVDGGGPITVRTRPCSLESGDYSIDGYARMVVVERKTKMDLGGTLTKGRRRFMAEMDRLREYDAAYVVIEAEISDIVKGFPFAPGILPRSIIRSWMVWTLRYPNIHWSCWPGRSWAECATYQLLRMWWRERIEVPARESRKREAKAWKAGTGKLLDGDWGG